MVLRLHEPGAQDRAHIAPGFEAVEVGRHHPQIRLGRQRRQHLRLLDNGRRDDRFDERGRQRLRRLEIDRPVQSHDAPEGRERIDVARADVGLRRRLARGDAARIRVL
jgi:hypothetical protein